MNQPFPDDTFLARWLSRELTAEERALFEQRPDYADYQRMVEEIGNLDIPNWDKVKQFEQLRARQNAKGRYYLTRRQWILGAAAAVIGMLLVAAYWTFLPGLPKVYRTATGSQRTITLPDQSVVLLNAESRLSYRAGQWLEARTLQLEGEAFFKVATAENTFTVQTKAGDITVLGTNFNVRMRDNLLTVACYEGQVAVSTSEGEQTLRAGDWLRTVDGKIQTTDQLPDSDQSPGWTSGTTSYRSWTAREVMIELARQYGKKLDWQAQHNPTISGGFPHDQLEVALQIVCQSANLNCTVDNQQTIHVGDQ